MQMLPNRVSLNFEDNPDLRDALAGKKAGDKCKLTLDVQLDEIDDKGVTASVEAAVPEGYAKAEGEGKSRTKDEDEDDYPAVTPVAIVMGKGKKK